MTLLRRALLVSASAVAGMAAFAWPGSHGRAQGTRSVAFTPADELTAEERARHERYMALALDRLEADHAENPPGPFAALIVNRHTGEIVCEGRNRYRDSPTFHGEIVAINACAQVIPRVEWPDLALYTTAEPCPMCMAAIVWTRIPEVVYGTSVDDLIKLGVNQFRLDSPTVAAAAPFYSGRIIGGVLKERTDPIYQRWAAARLK
jgi:tRNA(Arg) A34 adenosine deaminase TadA